jgi:hypothetical protein
MSLPASLLVGLLFELLGRLGVTLLGHSKEIKLEEKIQKIQWSWSAARYRWMSNLFKRLLLGLLGGLLFGLLGGLSDEQLNGLNDGLRIGAFVGLLSWPIIGLLGWLKDGFTVREIRAQSFPNEVIRRSVLNALVSGLFGGLFVGLLSGLCIGLFVGLLYELTSGLLIGLIFGISLGLLVGPFVGLHCGGRACLRHFSLRLMLWHNNFAPLRYIRFLDYAAARIFLHKTGGGYVFVHRMLLEYFAATHQLSAEQQKLQP